ncbi:MAG: hypothetical protein AVDCRST_MAG56-7403 [uncultured Cytophagales bacterium]|uniref:Uncharacterized protein n=1 Tax=uncultured Cytophagales bacterium TaxID=158755 RepID=A0A6J4L6C3_9SPHI|nr:MAG: hypothetical protein AVDCRST_MAG56-7403 [uncultured Cytophagales bacterium]
MPFSRKHVSHFLILQGITQLGWFIRTPYRHVKKRIESD